MSVSLKYVFPVANTSDVCALQTTAGAANLILNGNLANPISNQVSFISNGYSRSVSLTSTVNLSGVNFTIIGTQNGVSVSQTVAGPNNNTIYANPTTVVYDTITSISVSGAVATGVSIGTGYTGFFPLININLERDVINYSLSTAQVTAASIHTTIFNTNDNIYQNGSTFLNSVANDYNVFSIKASSADAQLYLPVANIVLCRSILIQINGALGEITNSIQMNFIQT
jgi:hypothetical protein